MLAGLSIHNVLLVDELNLEFVPGFNVLTGETGAGKSVLLDSLGFALGLPSGKHLGSDASATREVAASFEILPDHPSRSILTEQGYRIDEELLIRRVFSSNGRTRSFINGRRCPLEFLRELGDLLTNIHGQHDAHQLLNPGKHTGLLDTFGRLDDAVDKVQASWNQYRAHSRMVEAQEKKIASRMQDQEHIDFYLEEFEQFDLKPDEARQLEVDRSAMKFATQNREAIDFAEQQIGSEGASSQVVAALNALERLKGEPDDSVKEAREALERALSELQEAEGHISHHRQKLNIGPHELEELEDRLYAIRNLARKHGVAPEELHEYGKRLKQFQSNSQSESDHLESLKGHLEFLGGEYRSLAQSLSRARSSAADRLNKEIKREFKPLKLEKADFETAIAEVPEGPRGYDDVRFMVTTNPGFPLGPIDQIASGGELSRFLLALKACLIREDSGISLVFDEIDTGIGGATADAVGRRLKALSSKTQVIAVTHSPQVASLGDLHYQIEKRTVGSQSVIRAQSLSHEERVEEIARMLSAEAVSDEAMGAARVLLEAKA